MRTYLLSCGVVLLACSSRERAAVPAPPPSATESAPAPKLALTTCAADEDCAPMNCCYATREESCLPKARANCDKFKVECESYSGPKYACVCKEGACVGQWTNVGGVASPPDAGAFAFQPEIATGELPASAVLGVIMKRGADVRACRAKISKASGVATIAWDVTPAGGVQKAAVTSAFGVPSEVTTCLTRKIGGWRFPKAKGPTRVTYSFQFGSVRS